MSDRELPIGPILDGLGMKISIDDTAQVLDAITIALVASPDRDAPSMTISYSPGLHWVSRRGLIEEAADIIRGVPAVPAGNED